MGAWGTGILQDDTVLDVIGDFEDSLKNGRSLEDARAKIEQRIGSSLTDPDSEPGVRFGLAEAQWRFGAVDPDVLAAAKAAAEADDALWSEGAAKDRAARRKKVESFLRKIEVANPKPRRRPKIVVRKPKFAAGDCLAIALSNGKFGAAFVIVADHTQVEYGKNLIGVLDYMSDEPPGLEVFKKRKWLRKDFAKWEGKRDISWYLPARFRSEMHRFQVVGNLPVKRRDPKDANSYSPWSWLGPSVVRMKDPDHSADA